MSFAKKGQYLFWPCAYPHGRTARWMGGKSCVQTIWGGISPWKTSIPVGIWDQCRACKILACSGCRGVSFLENSSRCARRLCEIDCGVCRSIYYYIYRTNPNRTCSFAGAMSMRIAYGWLIHYLQVSLTRQVLTIYIMAISFRKVPSSSRTSGKVIPLLYQSRCLNKWSWYLYRPIAHDSGVFTHPMDFVPERHLGREPQQDPLDFAFSK